MYRFDKRFRNGNKVWNVEFDLNKPKACIVALVMICVAKFFFSYFFFDIFFSFSHRRFWVTAQISMQQHFLCSVMWGANLLSFISVPRHVFTCRSDFISSFIINTWWETERKSEHHFARADGPSFGFLVALALLYLSFYRYCISHMLNHSNIRRAVWNNKRNNQHRIKYAIATKNT